MKKFVVNAASRNVSIVMKSVLGLAILFCCNNLLGQQGGVIPIDILNKSSVDYNVSPGLVESESLQANTPVYSKNEMTKPVSSSEQVLGVAIYDENYSLVKQASGFEAVNFQYNSLPSGYYTIVTQTTKGNITNQVLVR